MFLVRKTKERASRDTVEFDILWEPVPQWKNENHILGERIIYDGTKGYEKEFLLVCLSLHECKIEEKERHQCHQSTEFLDGVPLTNGFSPPDF